MSNILDINCYLKFVEWVLFNVSSDCTNKQRTIEELKREFKKKFKTELPYLINQNFLIVRLLPIVFIKESLKKELDTKLQKHSDKIQIIRHAIAHSNFLLNTNGVVFKSDMGEYRATYKEIKDFIYEVENEYHSMPGS